MRRFSTQGVQKNLRHLLIYSCQGHSRFSLCHPFFDFRRFQQNAPRSVERAGRFHVTARHLLKNIGKLERNGALHFGLQRQRNGRRQITFGPNCRHHSGTNFNGGRRTRGPKRIRRVRRARCIRQYRLAQFLAVRFFDAARSGSGPSRSLRARLEQTRGRLLKKIKKWDLH